MADFYLVKAALDDVAVRVKQAQGIMETAKTRVSHAKVDMDSIGPQYGSLIAEIDQAAIDYPNDAAWQTAKAEKDHLVAEVASTKTRATDMETVLDPL